MQDSLELNGENGRENNRARVPDGTRVYAVGDIHGRRDLLDLLLADISADFRADPTARGVIVFLGDYVDRGPDVRGVLERLMAGPPAGMEAVCLKGNHEDFMMRFLDEKGFGEGWLMNGGGATLASYGATESDDMFDALWHLEDTRRKFADSLPAEHRTFLEGLQLRHREGDYIFVHAGLRPGVPLDAQSADDMMWIRDDFLYSEADFGAIVVHGHTPRPEPVFRENRIGIDTMAYRSGRLTCLVLEGDRRRLIDTGP